MADYVPLNFSWLERLTNPNHDNITQQIDDCAMSFVTDNARFIEKRNALHQCRLHEDEVWLVVQRDPVVKRLAAADNRQDAYITALRYTNLAHAGLPEGEPTKAEAVECNQVFKDFKFSTNDGYGAEADKIIQMQQNFQSHETFLTSIGAWTFLTKAVEQAHLVRELLLERAQTMGEFVKGEMKTARTTTDAAIADLFRTIDAMMDLMPSAELTALYTRMKGLELYAKQYNLPSGSSSSGSSSNSGNSQQGGTTENGEQGGSSENGGTEQGGGAEQGGGTENGGNGTLIDDPELDDNNGGQNGGGSNDNGGGNGGNGQLIDDGE